MRILVLASIVLMLVFFSLILLFLFFYQNKQAKIQQRIAEMASQHKQILLTTKLESQEDTFERVSREIHDNIGQKLSLAKLLISNSADSGHSKSRELISEAIQLLRQLSKAMFRESALENGLFEAIKSEISRLVSTGIYKVTFRSLGEESFFKDEAELVIYRIFQEGIQNVIKHADATEILIQLVYEPSRFALQICDNGKGLPPRFDEGMGIKNMRDRAQLFDGQVNLNNSLEGGTRVEVSFPHSIFSNES